MWTSLKSANPGQFANHLWEMRLALIHRQQFEDRRQAQYRHRAAVGVAKHGVPPSHLRRPRTIRFLGADHRRRQRGINSLPIVSSQLRRRLADIIGAVEKAVVRRPYHFSKT